MPRRRQNTPEHIRGHVHAGASRGIANRSLLLRRYPDLQLRDFRRLDHASSLADVNTSVMTATLRVTEGPIARATPRSLDLPSGARENARPFRGQM